MKYILICFLITSALQIEAQVKFNISLLADEETYLVSLIPEKTVAHPLNRVSNLQVVLKSEIENNLADVTIESLIPGIDWVNSAYFDKPNDVEPYTLHAITMVQSNTNAITFDENAETPLFTLKKNNADCVGKLMIPSNQNPEVLDAIKNKLNFTQSITMLSTRGNAYNGSENAEIDCQNLSTGANDPTLQLAVKAYPTPATDLINVEWTNSAGVQFSKIEVFSNNGKLLKELDISTSLGINNLPIDLSQYSSGIYSLRLRTTENTSTIKKFVVVN